MLLGREVRDSGTPSIRGPMRSRLIALVCVSLFGAIWPGFGQTTTCPGQTSPPPNLGFTSSFAVLGGSVTNSGSTTIIAGNVGTSPGNTAPGLSRSNFILGDPRLNDSLAQQAQKDTAAAYNNLAARSPTAPLTGDLGLGRTVVPGVYRVPPVAVLTGSLVLDACGDPNAVWIFEIDSSLTTNAGSTVQTINEGRDNNVFWRIGGPATFGTKSVFAGNVLATGSITIESNATISGRILTPGAVSLTDAGVTICCALLDMAPHVLPDGLPATEYTQTLTPKGGNGSYRFALAASDLQPGVVTVTESGVLSVKPTTAGVFKLAIAISDSTGINCIRVFRLVICGNIVLPDIPTPTACVDYKYEIKPSGGEPPYTVTTPPGTLPKDLQLVGNILKGVARLGQSTFSLTATDALGCSTTKSYSFDIQSDLTLATDMLTDGNAGDHYEAVFTAAGGTGPYTFTFAGDVPPDLVPSPVTPPSPIEKLTGTLTKPGCHAFTVTVTNGSCTVSKDYTIVVHPVVMFSDLPSPAKACTQYCETIRATGCTEPYRLEIEGSLPPGLTFDRKTRRLCGRPTKPDTYAFIVVATNPRGLSERKKYTLEILCPDPLIVDPELPQATACSTYQHQLPKPDCGDYFYTPTPGPLPDFLMLSVDGLLSSIPNTPTIAGDYHFSVTVTPKNCPPQNIPLHLIVACNVTISPPTLPLALLGAPYSKSLTASCGKPPYVFSTVSGSGSLPPGLSPLPANGMISGVPTTAGCFHFTVRAKSVTDPFCYGDHEYVICVLPATTDVPTLSGWGAAVLGFFLTIAGIVSIRRPGW